MTTIKILQINVVYKKGSTGKIVYDIHRELQQRNVESIVCYGRGQDVDEPNVYKISTEFLAKINALKSRITGMQYDGAYMATNKLINIIKTEQPDIVHLHCLNGYFVNIYRLFNFLKKNKIKTVLTLHAEFMHTGNCGHAYECERWKEGCGHCPQLWQATKSYWLDRTPLAWLKMKNAFEGYENLRIVAVSKWLEDRAKISPIMKNLNFSVINNGIDTKGIFKPTNYDCLKKKLGLKDEKILLHVTASFTLEDDDIKGGHYIVQLAKILKDERIKIIVIGARDLKMELPENIISVGIINNQCELAAYYSMADLTILTSKRETYSMVCAESLSCGTPVLGFKAGGPESIAIKEYAKFVESGNVNEMVDEIKEWINVKSNSGKIAISNVARNIYSRENMGLKYLKVYNELYMMH